MPLYLKDYRRNKLAVFTVKKLRYYCGEYYTYGGFLSSFYPMASSFYKTYLFANVRNCPPPESWEKIDNDNIEVIHLLSGRNEFEVALCIIPNIIKSMFYLLKYRPHYAHCRIPDFTGVYGYYLSSFLGIKTFVQVIADWDEERRKMPYGKKYFLGALLRLYYWFYVFCERAITKKTISFCQGLAAYNKNGGSNNNKLRLMISSSVTEADCIEKIRPINSYKKIIHIARLTGIKNQSFLIESVRRNIQVFADCRIELYGEGPLRESLKNLIEEYGLTNTSLKGNLAKGEQFWKILRNSDLFILTSISEGTPKVLLEAMANGVLVLAPEVGGIPYMLGNGSRGFMYEEGNKESFDAVIHQVLQSDHSIIRHRALTYAKKNTVESITFSMLKDLFIYYGE
jgi:glycosyltransferase involved in cell wall biosynthesis